MISEDNNCIASFVLQEWLSGRYNVESGYCTPSVRVLVDVVEHQAGGADPSLASSLAKLTFDQYLTGADETNTTQGIVNVGTRHLYRRAERFCKNQTLIWWIAQNQGQQNKCVGMI